MEIKNKLGIENIKKHINSLELQLFFSEEGNNWDRCAYRCEDLVRLYDQIGDEKNKLIYLKRAMIYYEKYMWYDKALKLAKELGDNKRAEIYEKLDKIRVFRDENKETQHLFELLKQYQFEDKDIRK